MAYQVPDVVSGRAEARGMVLASLRVDLGVCEVTSRMLRQERCWVVAMTVHEAKGSWMDACFETGDAKGAVQSCFAASVGHHDYRYVSTYDPT